MRGSRVEHLGVVGGILIIDETVKTSFELLAVPDAFSQCCCRGTVC